MSWMCDMRFRVVHMRRHPLLSHPHHRQLRRVAVRRNQALEVRPVFGVVCVWRITFFNSQSHIHYSLYLLGSLDSLPAFRLPTSWWVVISKASHLPHSHDVIVKISGHVDWEEKRLRVLHKTSARWSKRDFLRREGAIYVWESGNRVYCDSERYSRLWEATLWAYHHLESDLISFPTPLPQVYTRFSRCTHFPPTVLHSIFSQFSPSLDAEIHVKQTNCNDGGTSYEQKTAVLFLTIPLIRKTVLLLPLLMIRKDRFTSDDEEEEKKREKRVEKMSWKKRERKGCPNDVTDGYGGSSSVESWFSTAKHLILLLFSLSFFLHSFSFSRLLFKSLPMNERKTLISSSSQPHKRWPDPLLSSSLLSPAALRLLLPTQREQTSHATGKTVCVLPVCLCTLWWWAVALFKSRPLIARRWWCCWWKMRMRRNLLHLTRNV